MCTVEVCQSITHVLVVGRVLRHLSLQLGVLHAFEIRYIAVELEGLGYTQVIVLLCQMRSIDSQLLLLEVLQHALADVLAGLEVIFGVTLLVIGGNHSQRVGNEPVANTLLYSSAFYCLVNGLAELTVEPDALVLLVTDETGYIPGLGAVLCLLVLQRAFDSGTCAGEVRRLLHGKVLGCAYGFLLCKAACAYQHQCCQKD